MQQLNSHNMFMGYTKAALMGFCWHSVLKAVNLATSALKFFALARLLTPEAIGLFSLTSIALGVTEAMAETGINTTIIQSRQSINYFLDTAWVLSILRGLIIGSAMI